MHASLQHWAPYALCVASALCGAWLALALRRVAASTRGRAHNARGKRGERDAERLLEARGFRVQARQQRTRYRVAVDGDARDVELVVDFVVERDGETLIAEVKTGAAAAAGLERAETRRQLLEYQLASGTMRTLLVDPAAEIITEVAFPLVQTQPTLAASGWRTLLACTVLVALAVLWQRTHVLPRAAGSCPSASSLAAACSSNK